MKKLTFYDMVELLEKCNNGYYDFCDKKIEINNRTYSGEIYVLCNELTEEQKAIFDEYANVMIGDRTCLQCPEFHKNVIFLSDTNIEW